ncbi:MAG: UMP kinase [Gammaproteobacteria bacterium]
MFNLTQKSKYQRILLKLSGEELMGNASYGIDPKVLDRVATEISQVTELGVQVAIVIGGGNLFRGQALSEAGIGRVTGDQMGMLATMMNSLALRDALERAKVKTRTMSAIQMTGVIDAYDRRKAIVHLEEGRVVILSAGTGNPFFTTDSAASLRAIELDADLLLKATNVDGIYTADPKKHPSATLYRHVTYQEALERELGIMDLAAFCQCRDFNIDIRVFRMSKDGALLRILSGEEEGTLVSNRSEHDK